VKKYYYHPDKIIYIFNEDKTYFESVIFAKFDLGTAFVAPPEGVTEFEYIVGYGTKNFCKSDMVSFSSDPRIDLDNLIENIDFFIQKKNNRSVDNDQLWEIPSDMIHPKGVENVN